MADRIKFAVSALPIETITDENLGSHDILASEVNKVLAGHGDSVDLTAYNGIAANQGHLNGAVNYVSAAFAGNSAGSNITETAADFLFIKNTGHKYSSPTVLGAATDDCVMIALFIRAYENALNPGWVDANGTPRNVYIEVAWLKPGQGIVLPFGATKLTLNDWVASANDLFPAPFVSDVNTPNYVMKTFTNTGGTALSANAIEFLAVT